MSQIKEGDYVQVVDMSEKFNGVFCRVLAIPYENDREILTVERLDGVPWPGGDRLGNYYTWRFKKVDEGIVNLHGFQT